MSSRAVGIGAAGTPATASARILVVGDHGVGKSLLVQMLSSLSLGMPLPARGDRQGSTIAFSVEAVIWRDNASGKVALLELVELSGNRSLGFAARKSFYESKSLAAVIYVHDALNPQSIVALLDWHIEMGQCGVKVPFFVLGAICRPRRGGRPSAPLPSSPAGGSGKSIAMVIDRLSGLIPAQLLLAWARLQYAVLVVMAVILFGWSYSVSSALKPRAGKKVLADLGDDPRCRGFITDCPIHSTADFADHCTELHEFLSSVAFRF